MNNFFSPLDYDVRSRELVYVSSAKLAQLFLPTEAAGMGVTSPVFGMNFDTRKRETRELLKRAGKMFQDQGLLTYASSPQDGQWLLLRAVMMCGTAWPWAGALSQSNLTAWWVGSTESTRILAYGHRDHLLGQGMIPQSTSENPTATWWPSRSDASTQLLREISESVVEPDHIKYAHPWGIGDSISKQVARLEGSFFSNPGVQRGDPLVKRGVFEMMLRVDRTTENEDVPTVLGSPLWVARERRLVPGVYTVCNPSGASDESIVGDWGGAAWRYFRITKDHSSGPIRLGREPEIAYRAPDALGFEPRDPINDEIVHLGQLERPQQRSAGPESPTISPRWRRFVRSLARKGDPEPS